MIGPNAKFNKTKFEEAINAARGAVAESAASGMPAYDLFGAPRQTIWEVPLGGHVRNQLGSWGVDPGQAAIAERAAAGLISAGVGIPALLAAYQGLTGGGGQPQVVVEQNALDPAY
jgi:hypothetical protein